MHLAVGLTVASPHASPTQAQREGRWTSSVAGKFPALPFEVGREQPSVTLSAEYSHLANYEPSSSMIRRLFLLWRPRRCIPRGGSRSGGIQVANRHTGLVRNDI
jgi:hypothetical protein